MIIQSMLSRYQGVSWDKVLEAFEIGMIADICNSAKTQQPDPLGLTAIIVIEWRAVWCERYLEDAGL